MPSVSRVAVMNAHEDRNDDEGHERCALGGDDVGDVAGLDGEAADDAQHFARSAW